MKKSNHITSSDSEFSSTTELYEIYSSILTSDVGPLLGKCF